MDIGVGQKIIDKFTGEIYEVTEVNPSHIIYENDTSDGWVSHGGFDDNFEIYKGK